MNILGVGRSASTTTSIWLLGAMILAILNFHTIIQVNFTNFHYDNDNEKNAIRPLLQQFEKGKQLKRVTKRLLESYCSVEIDDGDDDDDSNSNSISKDEQDIQNTQTTIPQLIIPIFNDDQEQDIQCECDILSSLDCLDTIPCMTMNQHTSSTFDDDDDDIIEFHKNVMVWLGIELRRAIKQTVKFEGYVDNVKDYPLGKALQYNTIETWNRWKAENIIPIKYSTREDNKFVNESWYPYCQKPYSNGRRSQILHGRSCFFDHLSNAEDSAGTILENHAKEWFKMNFLERDENNKTDVTWILGRKVHRRIRIMLQDFVEEQQQVLHKRQRDPDRKTHKKEKRKYTYELSAFGSLMMFSHFTRLHFNRRPFLQDIYQDKLTTIISPKKASTKFNATGRHTRQMEPFSVALHIRRGDSCGGDPAQDPETYYDSEDTPLDSPPQMTSQRKCYKTKVYLDAIEKIRSLMPKNQPLHVYLSTDDSRNVIDEIQTNFTYVYDNVVDQWHYLNYSRTHFDYNADSIEAEDNNKRPILGETAIADLWLLSHGQAFVGHLGSRFGKVSWLLATSRHNMFIPYYTVDGHSFCCEIDESCGKVRPYIQDMENCMTFSHEYLGYEFGDEYWTQGSIARKIAYEEKNRINITSSDEYPERETQSNDDTERYY